MRVLEQQDTSDVEASKPQALSDARVIELQGINNVRDLGGIPIEGGRIVARGLIYRGSALADITERDQNLLFGELGITRIIDLRCGWECEAKPDVEVPDVENLHIPFYDLEKVGIEYTEPTAGTKTVGRDVACEPSRFYRSLSNPLTVRQMCEGLHAVLDHAMGGQPVYVHCSGGKDRAGIMTLLILTVLGASEEDILEDYLLTNVARDKDYDRVFARFLRLAQGDEERAREITDAHRALPENIVAFRSAIEESYGSMDMFLSNELAVSADYQTRVRAACTEVRT